jgi:AraC family transcriptional regulator
MGLFSRVLACGPGWRVSDVVCSAGPGDPPFEEQHDGFCIAAVMQGTFQYRSTRGTAVLGPGAVLLGNSGQCFECGHEHGRGDRCLSFRLTPDFFETIVAAVPGACSTEFRAPRLPPLASLGRLFAAAEVARDSDCSEFEELTVSFVGAVTAGLADGRVDFRAPTARDAQRVSDAQRRIEQRADELETAVSLSDLAREAGMSRFHFLRVFRQIVGMTPHQFVLHTRLHRAAVRLRVSQEPVSSIALDHGFADLSTFNRQFRRAMGLSPSAYRARRVYKGAAASV